MESLSVDLFFYLIPYLSFKDVISISQINRKFRRLCKEYPNRWRELIDKTYHFVYNYQKKLIKTQEICKTENNYLIYIRLSELIDPISCEMYLNHLTVSKQASDSSNKLANILLKLKKSKNIKENFFNDRSVECEFELYFDSQTKLNGFAINFSDYQNIEGMELLRVMGADIHFNDEQILRYAAGIGAVDVVEYLIEHNCDIHARENEPLRWAAESGHLEVVKLLVENGANKHARFSTAVNYARANKHWDVVNYLESL